MGAEMAITHHTNARLTRLTLTGLLAMAVALMMAWPGAADAKKHPRTKCPATHAKGPKAKKLKRCTKRAARRHGSRPPTATRPSTQSGSTTTTSSSGDVARCQSERAQDPAGFADLYGVGADDEGAVENCVTASHDTSSTEDDSAEPSG